MLEAIRQGLLGQQVEHANEAKDHAYPDNPLLIAAEYVIFPMTEAAAVSLQLANYVWLGKLFEKIRHLSKECEMSIEPYRKDQPIDQIASGLITVVEDIVKHVIDLRSV